MAKPLQATKHGLKRIEERSPIKDRIKLVEYLRKYTVRVYKGSFDNRLYLVTGAELNGSGDKYSKNYKREDKYVYVFATNKKLVTLYEKDNYVSIRVMFKRGIKIYDVQSALDYLFG